LAHGRQIIMYVHWTNKSTLPLAMAPVSTPGPTPAGWIVGPSGEAD
jgi:hypothetical protein